MIDNNFCNYDTCIINGLFLYMEIFTCTAFHFWMQGLSEDKQFIGESLLSRLQDDDPAVVASVLKLGQVHSSLLF